MPSKYSTTEERAAALPGFPKEEPFTEYADVREYLSGDRIQCLRCGKEYRALGTHLRVHGIGVDEYKKFYGLPVSGGTSNGVSRGLTCSSTAAKYSVCAKERASKHRSAMLSRLDAHRADAITGSKKSTKPTYALHLPNLGRHQGPGPYGYPDAIWDEFLLRVRSGRTPAEVTMDDEMPGETAMHRKRGDDESFAKRLADTWDALPYTVQARSRRLSQDVLGVAAQKLVDGGATQAEVATALGVSQMTVSRYTTVNDEQRRLRKPTALVVATRKARRDAAMAKCPTCGDVFQSGSYGGGQRQTFCKKGCIRRRTEPLRKCAGCKKTLPLGSQHNGVKRCNKCAHEMKRVPREEKRRRQRVYDRERYRRRILDPAFVKTERTRNRHRMRKLRAEAKAVGTCSSS